MRSHATLLYGFLARNFIIIRRYPLNFLGTLATYLMVFMMIFWGGKEIGPEVIGESLDAIIVGFFLLTTVLSTFFSLSGLVNSEAKYGTLEQLYVSPFRFSTVMFAAVTANIVLSVTIGTTNLLVVLFITEQTLTIDLPTVVPILALTILAAIGLSFLLAGVALLYKRIKGLFSIVQFLFLGLISMALTDAFWPRLLPIGQGSAMLHAAMTRGVSLLEFKPIDHAILVGTGVGYLVLGYLAFYLAQHEARQRGLLDDY